MAADVVPGAAVVPDAVAAGADVVPGAAVDDAADAEVVAGEAAAVDTGLGGNGGRDRIGGVAILAVVPGAAVVCATDAVEAAGADVVPDDAAVVAGCVEAGAAVVAACACAAVVRGSVGCAPGFGLGGNGGSV